jgi:hypothetical protein
MESLSTLIIVFSLGLILYSLYDLRKFYNRYKADRGFLSYKIFVGSIAGLILGILFLTLHFLGYIEG